MHASQSQNGIDLISSHLKNSETVLNKYKHRVPFEHSLKYKYVQNDEVNIDSHKFSPDRKRSVQSYNRNNKEKVHGYIGDTKDSYNNSSKVFTKRDAQPHSWSRTQINPWKTPNTTSGTQYYISESNSIVHNNQKPKNNALKSYERTAPTIKYDNSNKQGTLIDFWSLYINQDQIVYGDNKQYNQEMFTYLPKIDNSKEYHNKPRGYFGYQREINIYQKGPQNKIWFMHSQKRKQQNNRELGLRNGMKSTKENSQMKITFNKKSSVTQNYLNNPSRRRSNNLSKLHEFENKLLVGQSQQDVIIRREKVASSSKRKDNKSLPARIFLTSSKRQYISTVNNDSI